MLSQSIVTMLFSKHTTNKWSCQIFKMVNGTFLTVVDHIEHTVMYFVFGQRFAMTVRK